MRARSALDRSNTAQEKLGFVLSYVAVDSRYRWLDGLVFLFIGVGLFGRKIYLASDSLRDTVAGFVLQRIQSTDFSRYRFKAQA